MELVLIWYDSTFDILARSSGERALQFEATAWMKMMYVAHPNAAQLSGLSMWKLIESNGPLCVDIASSVPSLPHCMIFDTG
jgi:hypothetical protein